MTNSARLLALLAFASFSACSSDTSGLNDGSVPPPVPCTNDDQCSADQHCANGMCTAGSGNECTTDAQCGAGETCMIVMNCGASRCHGNTCVAKSCTDHDDCNGWLCESGSCIEPPACNAMMPCPAGSECDANTGRCVPSPDETCMQDDDCTTEGEICLGGVCTEGISCMTSADCPMDMQCHRMFCREECTEDSDCGPTFAWNCDEPSGQCQQRCTGDNICPDNTICEMLLCEPAECLEAADCAMNEECQNIPHGRCVEIFPCDAPGGCPEGTICNMMTNRCDPLDRCVGDRSCPDDFYCDNGYCQPTTDCTTTACAEGFDCVGSTCVPEVCRGDADCTVMGERCISGACQIPPMPTEVTQVRIITPAGVVRPGGTYQFTAVALDQGGAVVPGVTFMWTTTSSAVASIDQDGLATGGNQAGTTIIIASVFNGMSTINSPGVNLVNLGPLAAGDLRVSVVSLSGGSPVGGAEVTIERPGFSQTITTGFGGVATFTGAGGGDPYTVTVAHASFDYVSVLDLSANDVLIPLPPISKPSLAGGIKGTIDFSRVTTTGGLYISLNGASIASPLITFDAAQLFGGAIFQVPVPTVGNVPVAAANTVAVDFMGALIPLKDVYYARATTGLRATWGLGGRIGLDVFGLGGGGGGGAGNIIGTILPYLQRFEHAVRPVIDVVAIPTIVDTADIDGDGDTAETVPDYMGFPAVPLRPDTAQSLRYFLSVDNLPFVSGGNANTLIVVAGMILPSVGFVPLGLDGMQDMAGNGVVDPFITKVAPPHGGLEVGEYAVLASAVRVEMGGLPGPGSARLYVGTSLPANVDLSDGWLDSPLDATWDEAMRQVALPPLASVDLYRIALASEDGTWHVYAPAPAMGSINVPNPTTMLVDRSIGAVVTVDAVDLTTNQTVSTMFDVSAGGAMAIDRATRGFSRAVLAP